MSDSIGREVLETRLAEIDRHLRRIEASIEGVTHLLRAEAERLGRMEQHAAVSDVLIQDVRKDIDKCFGRLRAVEGSAASSSRHLTWAMGYAACITMLGGYFINNMSDWVKRMDQAIYEVQRTLAREEGRQQR